MAALLAVGAVEPPAGDRDDEFRRARVGLKSGDKWVRKTAVEKLARLDTEDAWELVAEALEDPRGEVADTAQVLLARASTAWVLDRLDPRSVRRLRDPWPRRRAAEVVGRLAGPVPAEFLLGYRRDKDAETRRMALWSLERLARGDRLEEPSAEDLRRLVRWSLDDRDATVRARGLAARLAFARGANEGVPAEPLGAALQERSAAVRCMASALAGQLTSDAALPLLGPAARDSSLAVRTQVVDSLRSLRTRGAIELLIDRLEHEVEHRLRHRLIGHLRSLSGLKHGADVRPWRRWLQGLPLDYRAAPAEPLVREPVDDRSSSLAGLPILSRRVAILIDFSGSIWQLRGDGTTRKEHVDRQLAAALQGLDPDTLFNVIPYTGEPHPFAPELVPATPRTVKKALSFVAECDERGTGNVWDALMLALADPAVDTVIVLTDGAPTGGHRFHLDLLSALFLERNATRRVVLDAILVGASARLRSSWEALCAATGGICLAADWD